MKKKDELSGEKSSTTRLNFKSSGGAALTAELGCTEWSFIRMTLTVTSGTIPTTYTKGGTYAQVRVKSNDTIEDSIYMQSQQYKNVFTAIIYEIKKGKAYSNASIIGKESPPAYIYIADVPTNMGNIIIKVPPYDNAVYALGQTCK